MQLLVWKKRFLCNPVSDARDLDLAMIMCMCTGFISVLIVELVIHTTSPYSTVCPVTSATNVSTSMPHSALLDSTTLRSVSGRAFHSTRLDIRTTNSRQVCYNSIRHISTFFLKSRNSGIFPGFLCCCEPSPSFSSRGVLNVAFTVLSWSIWHAMTLEAYPGLTPILSSTLPVIKCQKTLCCIGGATPKFLGGPNTSLHLPFLPLYIFSSSPVSLHTLRSRGPLNRGRVLGAL